MTFLMFLEQLENMLNHKDLEKFKRRQRLLLRKNKKIAILALPQT